MDDVIYMSQQPFVRAFLLDSVDIGCGKLFIHLVYTKSQVSLYRTIATLVREGLNINAG